VDEADELRRQLHSALSRGSPGSRFASSVGASETLTVIKETSEVLNPGAEKLTRYVPGTSNEKR